MTYRTIWRLGKVIGLDGVFSCPFWSTVLQCGAPLPIHTLNYWTAQSVVPGFYLMMCLSVTLLIVDSWQHCVCCIRSGLTRWTHIMVLFLDRMCQCGLHAVLWSHIGILMHRLAAEPRSTAGLFSPVSACPSGTILLTPYSMEWDWRVSRAEPILSIGLSCFIHTIVYYHCYFSLPPRGQWMDYKRRILCG